MSTYCGGIVWGTYSQEGDGSDLTKKRYPGVESNQYKILGELAALNDYDFAFSFGTLFYRDNGEARKLFNHFVFGDGSTYLFPSDSKISEAIRNSNNFKVFKQNLEGAIQTVLNISGSISNEQVTEFMAKKPLGYFDYGSSSLYLHTVMGGYKEVRATFSISNGRIKKSQYEISDNFGADVGDSHSNLPGLAALYYLQRYGTRHNYRPFRWHVLINFNY